MLIILCDRHDRGPDPEQIYAVDTASRHHGQPRSPKETRRAQRKGGRRR